MAITATVAILFLGMNIRAEYYLLSDPEITLFKGSGITMLVLIFATIYLMQRSEKGKHTP
jgi:hypothetical protein